MPELPEVETIRRGLAPRLIGRTIEAVRLSGKAMRKPSPRPLDQLVGRTIQGVTRHAKVMGWTLDDGSEVSVHLGMTGKVLLDAADRPHTHVHLRLDDDTEVAFVDPRRFGWFAWYAGPSSDVAHYGPDALAPAFTARYLAEAMKASRAPLKSFLLDQTKVAGLGNIYVCEALWRAGLSPRRLACNAWRRAETLHEHIQGVLNAALAQGGTSFNDYVDTLGSPGEFIADLAVFQQQERPCPRCEAPVRRIVQSGRSTFYCPSCQR